LNKMASVELSSYPNVLALVAAFALAYGAYTAIYRLYFHPLAEFPGPLWARLTDFPSWWHTLKQDRHVWLHQLQEEYGKLSVPSQLYLSGVDSHNFQALSFDTDLMQSSSTLRLPSSTFMGPKVTRGRAITTRSGLRTRTPSTPGALLMYQHIPGSDVF
jgi:hypothetical protein